jgi:hypothetical protein
MGLVHCEWEVFMNGENGCHVALHIFDASRVNEVVSFCILGFEEGVQSLGLAYSLIIHS